MSQNLFLYHKCIIRSCIASYHQRTDHSGHLFTFLFQLRQKILEAHANVKDLNLLEAKVNFIKAWQSLPDYGVSLFVVRFHGEKKDELLGIASNKIMRMSLNNGDHIKTWRFSTMKVCFSLLFVKKLFTNDPQYFFHFRHGTLTGKPSI